MMIPRISDVLHCTPSGMAKPQMIQLTLDVSKTNRRILIDPKNGGMLCFANGELYCRIALTFGVCTSGWYWGRVAGLMLRTSHVLLAHGHTLCQISVLPEKLQRIVGQLGQISKCSKPSVKKLQSFIGRLFYGSLLRGTICDLC